MTKPTSHGPHCHRSGARLGSARMYSFIEQPITRYITRRYQQAKMLRHPVAARGMPIGPRKDATASGLKA